MTDSRITRIVDQLADLSDEEIQNLVETINTKRTEMKKEKQEKAIREFITSFQNLVMLNVDTIYFNGASEEILHLEDISFKPW